MQFSCASVFMADQAWTGLFFCLLVIISIFPAAGQLTEEDMEALQREAVEKGWTFTVGENAATQRPVEHLAGLKITAEALTEASHKTAPRIVLEKELPSRFDWREEVSAPLPPIKDQGSCGSCWAFATVGALEWAIKIADGDQVRLSEQWLLGCNISSFWNNCDGGFLAHNYHLMPGAPYAQGDQCGDSGAVLEADCPYLGQDDVCGCPYTHRYWIQDWAYVGGVLTPPPVDDIKAALYTYGPLSSYVNMSKSFIAYTGGVFNDHDSEKIEMTDHAVVLVGWDDSYGSEGAWIVKNSWGTYWGEDGYGYMEYGVNLIGAGASYLIYGDALKASPSAISATGEMGGPFSSTGDEVLLKNSGDSMLTWSATAPDWLRLSSSEGTLAAGEQEYLGISLEEAVYAFGPEVYTGVITVVNEDTGGISPVVVTLTVLAPLVYEFPLDTDPGWSREGLWSFGAPQNGGSHNGNPESACTGDNVYGYNLAGDYENTLLERALTTTALDFSAYTGVELQFMRWLGVEQGRYDTASVRVSTDKTNWTVLWQNPVNTDVEDTAWTACVYDISAFADGQSQFYVQWVMGPTDSSVTFPGWNVDDIQFRGLLAVEGEGEMEGECEELLPYFTASPMNGVAPLTVAFTNHTTGQDGVIWEFGDGGFTMDWEPTHTFEAPGTFTVTLRAWNLCEEKTWHETITVDAPEGESEGEGEFPIPHPGDVNADFQLVLSETITYLSGWQQGGNPIAYAVRAAFLWQNGEAYIYDPQATPPLCWVLSP